MTKNHLFSHPLSDLMLLASSFLLSGPVNDLMVPRRKTHLSFSCPNCPAGFHPSFTYKSLSRKFVFFLTCPSCLRLLRWPCCPSLCQIQQKWITRIRTRLLLLVAQIDPASFHLSFLQSRALKYRVEHLITNEVCPPPQLPESTPLKDTPLGGIRTGGQGVLRSSRAIRAFVLNSLDYKYTLRDKDKATDEYHELQAKVRNSMSAFFPSKKETMEYPGLAAIFLNCLGCKYRNFDCTRLCSVF